MTIKRSNFSFDLIREELVRVNKWYEVGNLDELFGTLRSYDDLTQNDVLLECSRFTDSDSAFFEALVRFVESCFVIRIDVGEAI